MADLLSGLEALGLGKLKGLDIFGEEKSNAAAGGKPGEQVKAAEPVEEDFLLDKTFECPVCDKTFKAKIIKVGKAKLIGQDTDLRPHYSVVDVLKYDAVVCEYCGYAALTRYFKPGLLTSSQIKLIREGITKTFRGLSTGNDKTYSYDEAILRHKLVLASTVVKRAKVSEKSYTCLKIGWLIRAKYEEMISKHQGTAEEIKQLQQEELAFLDNAYKGFIDAFSKENFPMCGMDEWTLTYLTADLARRTGKTEEASRWCSKVITSREANDRIKEKARELKDSIIGVADANKKAEAAKAAALQNARKKV
ncbi:MAG: DUF2225 domain-containing protein [Lachnospiraceae bacterium]|nr:DUF2225 domain-containing protein [Lachnospiraceae bacterium]